VADGPRSRQFQRGVRWTVLTFIVGVILYQLFEIGWGDVLRNLPTHPLFYLLFFVLYLTLPTGEVFIYRQVWPVSKWRLFKAFLSKRVYNEEVMGYSGEFFLFVRARNWLDKEDREILRSIRDNNILSAVSSNLVAFSLIGILVFTGVIELDDLIGNVDLFYIITGIVLVAALIAVVVQFRSYIFNLSWKKASVIFSIYLTRFVFHHSLMILQWAVVIPETPLSIWFLFVAIIIVVNRIPFLPSRDLIFLWAGIELSRMLNMTTAAVAGMLLVSSALKKLTNLTLFLLLSTYSNDPDMKPIDGHEDVSRSEDQDSSLTG